MTRADLESYLGRPWALFAEMKASYWAERKRRLGRAEGLRIAGELRRQYLLRRSAPPPAGDRAADVECHTRVSEALRSVARTRGV